MFEIVPTILTSEIEDFTQKIGLLNGVVPRIQIDIIDGIFAESKTLDLGIIRDLGEVTKLKVDLHLMVEEPSGWINRSLEVVPDRIIGHVEKMSNPWAFLNEVIESGTQVGLAIDLETPVEKVSEDIYLLADLIMLLGVKAGKGGQEFDSRVLGKIKKIREILGEMGKIGVDGGMNEENIKLCKKAGANIFYVGNYFWQALNHNGSEQAEDLQKRYNELLEVITNN